MTTTILKILFLGGIASSFISFDLPVGWGKAGSFPKSYDMGIALGEGENSKNAATIKSIDKEIDGFGTLMQTCRPDRFVGKRVKLTASIRTESVIDGASLWFRVDQCKSEESLSFDNMGDRPVVGTTDWHKYEIVLDVPNNASLLAYGVLLIGTGQVWFDNISFDIVDETTPTTGSINGKKSAMKTEPVNLDFEK